MERIFTRVKQKYIIDEGLKNLVPLLQLTPPEGK
jgi:hypothetical protein